MDTDRKNPSSHPRASALVRGRFVFSFLIFCLASVATAAPHPPLSAIAYIRFEPGGHFTLTLPHDSLAFALDDTSLAIGDQAMYALLRGPEDDLAAAFQDGRERFESQLRITADGRPLAFKLTDSPSADKARQWERDNPRQILPVRLEFVVEADLPPGTRSATFTFPTVLDQVVISVQRPNLEPQILPVSPGETSPPIDVSMITGAAPDNTKPAGESALAVAWRFTKLGFAHILGPTGDRWWQPQGLDHCLFVLGLFLLIPKFKPVLWQISAFTLAHTLTLTLTSLHMIGLSSRIVEPTIAATIAFIGVENLVSKKVSPWRIAAAFVFGLVHGMGVATAFNEAGFPPGQLVTSLAAFTVGVEAGHIAVLIVAFATLAWFRNKPWYRRRIAIPLSVLIAAVGLLWIMQRLTA